MTPWPPRTWRTPDVDQPRRVNTTFGELWTSPDGAPDQTEHPTTNEEDTTNGHQHP